MKNKIKKALGLVLNGAFIFACASATSWLDYKIMGLAYNWLPIQLWFSVAALCLAANVFCLYRLLIVKMFLESISKLEAEPPEQGPVAANHGNQLTEVMEAIRDEKYEYCAFFDLAGNKLVEGTYLSPRRCGVTAEDWHALRSGKTDAIVVHNHPNSYDWTFSGSDFEVFLHDEFIKQAVVVTKHYNYFLEKTELGRAYPEGAATVYSDKMDIRYIWICFFSLRLWSVAVARKTAKHFGLKFAAKRVRRASAKRSAWSLAVDSPSTN